MVERAWLCGLVVLLWAEGDACLESRGPTDREWLNPTDSLGNHQHSPIPYRWVAALTVLCVSLAGCLLLCCCSFYPSRPPSPRQPSSVECIPMEDLEHPLESPTSAASSQLSSSVGDPRGHPEAPPPSPVVQFHRAYAESVEDGAPLRPLVHRGLSRLLSQPSGETDLPLPH
ncbi:uncharacterized protein LOC144584477 isoform X3 [Pogona vitticeps]